MHAATGGVGLAAVQVAKALGCAVLTTASSPSKRNMLRDMAATAAVNSRSTEFASILGTKPIGDNIIFWVTLSDTSIARLFHYFFCAQALVKMHILLKE